MFVYKLGSISFPKTYVKLQKNNFNNTLFNFFLVCFSQFKSVFDTFCPYYFRPYSAYLKSCFVIFIRRFGILFFWVKYRFLFDFSVDRLQNGNIDIKCVQFQNKQEVMYCVNGKIISSSTTSLSNHFTTIEDIS